MSLKDVKKHALPHFEDYYLLSSSKNDSFINQNREGAVSYINHLNDKKILDLMKTFKQKISLKENNNLPSLQDLNKINFKKSNTIVLLNGKFSKKLSNYDNKDIEIIEKYLEADIEKSVFASLNCAYTINPISFLIINTPKRPIHIIHLNTNDKKEMFFGHISIVCANRIKVNIQESFIDFRYSAGAYNRLLIINLGKSSKLNYNPIFNIKKSEICLYNQFNLEQDSNMILSNKIKKLKNIWHDEQIYLSQNSEFINKSIFKNFKKCNYKFEIIHKSDSQSSTLLKNYNKSNEDIKIKGCLSVPINQENIKANQKFDSLNLGKNSKTEFLPILNIENENVDVNHGSTIRQINKSEIDYLTSKGININNAKKMLIKAFLGS